MKKCTGLWGEAHFQVKMYKTPQLRSIFWSCDVEKVHDAVARSTFGSENCKNLRGSAHFWTCRLRFVWQAHGILHLVKSEQKRVGFVAFAERMAGHYNYNYITVTTTTTLHFTTLHNTTLHYTTGHYTALRYTTLQLQLQLQLHYLTLHYITLHYITLHHTYTCTTTTQQVQLQQRCTRGYNYTTTALQLHYTTLRYTTLHCLQPPFDPSVGSICHSCITPTHLSYSLLSLKLPPPPCAALLVLDCVWNR